MAKERVERTRADGVKQHYYVGTDIVPPSPQDKDIIVLSAATTPDSVSTTADYDEWLAAAHALLAPAAEDETIEPVSLISQEEMERVFNTPSDLVVETAGKIVTVMGAPKGSTRDYLNKVTSRMPYLTSPDTTYAESTTTRAVLEECLKKGAATAEGRNLLEQVESGTAMFTERELVMLIGVKRLIEEDQYEESLASIPDGTDWIPYRVNRQCTLCGQFIGERSDHAECPGKLPEEAVEYRRKSGFGTAKFRLRRKIVLPKELFLLDEDGKEKTLPLWVLKSFPASDDERQDAYYAKGNLARVEVGKFDYFKEILSTTSRLMDQPTDMLYSYMTPPLLAGAPKLKLPAGLRAAFIENPQQGFDPYEIKGTSLEDIRERTRIIAATIDPPLQNYEISHLLDKGGSSVAMGLLEAKRTRSTALRLLETEPSSGGMVLAARGVFSSASLDTMISNPDIFVVKEAASAPNLTLDQARSLASHPHPDVRRTLLEPPGLTVKRKGVPAQRQAINMPNGDRARSVFSHHPELLPLLLNDPDEEIASEAFIYSGKRFTSQHMAAVTTVTSKRRLLLFGSIVKGSGRLGASDDDERNRLRLLAIIQEKLNS